ncbi:MAG: hypothetical protein ACI4PF_06050 [Christensenellales bacterium]
MGKFLKQLTDSEIIKFLRMNNYILYEDLKDDEGKPIPAMERSDDLVFMRCQRVLDEGEQEIDKRVAYELMKKYPRFLTFTMLSRFGEYSTDIDLITLSDFDANLITGDFFDREQRLDKLFSNYIDFMLNRFKDQNYREALIEDFESSKDQNEQSM